MKLNEWELRLLDRSHRTVILMILDNFNSNMLVRMDSDLRLFSLVAGGGKSQETDQNVMFLFFFFFFFLIYFFFYTSVCAN